MEYIYIELFILILVICIMSITICYFFGAKLKYWN